MSAAAELAKCRAALDEIDAGIVEALARRMDVCRRVAAVKKREGIPMMNQGRIDHVRAKARARASEFGENPDFVEEVFKIVIAEACRVEDEIIDQAGSGAGS